MTRPPFVPADSALSYFEARRRKAYTYRRYLGYTYRRYKGRRRRVHHYKQVAVPSRLVLYWIVEAPPPSPPPTAPPRGPQPLPLPKGWVLCVEWQDYLLQWAENEGFGGKNEAAIAFDGDIYKKNKSTDVIDSKLFVWPSARHPRGLVLKRHSILKDKVFNRVRLWVLIENVKSKQLFVWIRTSVLPTPMNFDEVSKSIPRYVKKIQKELDGLTYISFRYMIAWTVYTIDQLSRTKSVGAKTRSKELRKTSDLLALIEKQKAQIRRLKEGPQ